MKMKMKISLLVLALSIVSGSIMAEEAIETWECRKGTYTGTPILVKAFVNKGRDTGRIEVAGVTHYAFFEVQGFNRRWDFGAAEAVPFQFAFIIKPNGRGSYYDFEFESRTEPSLILNCRQK